MPFTAEELWQELNNFKSWKKENSVHLQDWPTFEKKLATEDEIELPIQINGKLKATINVANDISEDDVERLATEAINEKLGEKEIKMFIYVPGRVVNFVV